MFARSLGWAWMVLVLPAGGCGGGDAGMELAAGDAALAIADQLQTAVGEYHAEVSKADDGREHAVVAAFVQRVQADHADQSRVTTHVGEFEAALGKIRQDRELEQQRRAAAMDNVAALRELAGGMQKLALESLTLSDEMRRYLAGWVELRRRGATRDAAQKGGAHE